MIDSPIKALKNVLQNFPLRKDAGPCTSAKVLLVDDYEPNVMIAGTYLENFGYEYEVASSGQEAIDRIKDQIYGAVLMDIQMPQMDGIEASQHIRRLEEEAGRARMPIIALTAHALSGDRETCLAAGMDEYIAKPFNPQHLKYLLSSLMNAEPSKVR